MRPNIDIDGIQLDTYLKQYNIRTDLNIIRYKKEYSLNTCVENVNTDVFYSDTVITEDDVVFKQNITDQEKNLIIIALNRLRMKVN